MLIGEVDGLKSGKLLMAGILGEDYRDKMAEVL